MTKFYFIGGILFLGSLLSIEIMNVMDAKKIEKLNAEMRTEFNEKQKKEISLMKKFCLESDPSDLYLIDLETLCEGYWWKQQQQLIQFKLQNLMDLRLF